MSLSKRLCKRSPTEVRQSFCERIWDDLSEEILQYLSLKNKLRLECVSKQFQRTVFKRHYELQIINYSDDRYTENIEKLILNKDSIDLKSLESLLKKCLNITFIEFDFDHWGLGPSNYNEFIDLITKYCKNLVDFKSFFNGITVSAYEEFHNKFGSKLKAIVLQNCMKNFPNLKELVIEMLNTKQFKLMNKFNFEKLKKLNATVGFIEEEAQLFLDSFPSLRYLDLIIRTTNLNMDLKNISKLKDLIHLKIDGIVIPFNGFALSDKIFSNSMKEIAKNCRKLKSFESVVILEATEGLTLRQWLSPLKEFEQLKRLRLGVNGWKDFYGKFSMNAFEGLSNLTHLTLAFYSQFELKDNRFTKIDIHLPNLQYLVLIDVIGDEAQTADILSRLSNLKTFKCISFSEYFCRKFEEEITQKCPQITNIHIKYEKNPSALLRLVEN